MASFKSCKQQNHPYLDQLCNRPRARTLLCPFKQTLYHHPQFLQSSDSSKEPPQLCPRVCHPGAKAHHTPPQAVSKSSTLLQQPVASQVAARLDVLVWLE